MRNFFTMKKLVPTFILQVMGIGVFAMMLVVELTVSETTAPVASTAECQAGGLSPVMNRIDVHVTCGLPQGDVEANVTDSKLVVALFSTTSRLLNCAITQNGAIRQCTLRDSSP